MRCLGLHIAFSLCLATMASGQVQVDVITKTIEQTYDYYPGDAILIKGEKATITVNSWTDNEVKVNLKLVAKARDTETAERELEFQRYIMEKKKGVISLANYYAIPSGSKLNSILIAEYELFVPVNARITMDNNYGNISMQGTTGRYVINNKFGKIVLDDVGGIGDVECYFGDFIATELSGQTTVRLNKSKTLIIGISGTLDLETNLGDVTISDPESIRSLEVKAAKSDVNFELSNDWVNYGFDLQSEFGKVMFSSEYKLIAKEKANVSYYKLKKPGQPEIKCSTNFGSISVSLK